MPHWMNMQPKYNHTSIIIIFIHIYIYIIYTDISYKFSTHIHISATYKKISGHNVGGSEQNPRINWIPQILFFTETL